VSRASANTRIENVAVSNSSLYGLSLAAATGLTVNSLEVSNMTSNAIGTAGIYATGFCTNSNISATTFTGNFNKKLDVTKSRNLVITAT
jgi:hypothetical protein